MTGRRWGMGRVANPPRGDTTTHVWKNRGRVGLERVHYGKREQISGERRRSTVNTRNSERRLGVKEENSSAADTESEVKNPS